MRVLAAVTILGALALGACSQPPVKVVYGTGVAVTATASRDFVPLPAPRKPAVTTARISPKPAPKPRVNATAREAAPVTPGEVRVQPGDSVYAIARRHGASVRDIIAANRLEPPYKLLVGQTLRLPTGRYHVVATGDTIHSVSRRYDVSMSALVRLNDIPPPYRLTPGAQLRMPTPRPRIQTASIQRTAPVETRPDPTVAPVKIPRPPPAQAGTKFLWPVKGPILSDFGPQSGGLHNDGINIDVPAGTPVRAAQNGVVAYAGNELRGYGNLLLLRHEDGWMTAYAHNETLLVKRGDIVKRGEVISRSGRTGRVSSPQAHFEIRRNGQPLDPRKYLASN